MLVSGHACGTRRCHLLVFSLSVLPINLYLIKPVNAPVIFFRYMANTETYLKNVALKHMPPNLQKVSLLKSGEYIQTPGNLNIVAAGVWGKLWGA